MIEIKCPDVLKFKPLDSSVIFMAGGTNWLGEVLTRVRDDIIKQQ